MAGICGWLGFGHTINEARDTLHDMGATLGNVAPPVTQEACATHAVLALSGKGNASTYRTPEVLSVLTGRVHWDDPELDQITQRASPAAALARAYEKHGIACLTHLHGPFALALVMPQQNRVLLAIDRMGIHRLCFFTQPEGIVFGSTLDSVTAHPAASRKLEMQGIFNYLFHHVIPAPGTIYSGSEKLLPAQYLLFENGHIHRNFYWQAAWDHDKSSDFATYRRTFRQVLHESVQSAMATDRCGAFLSGGTDSSTVCGIMTDIGPAPIHTFSMGFEAQGYDEIGYARLASRHFHTVGHEYYVTPDDVVQAIPEIAAGFDEPFGNASAIPTFICARQAHAQGIAVMLAGDGGDEIFGGNVRYAKQKVFEYYWHLPKWVRATLIEPALLHAPFMARIPGLRKAQSYVRQARVPLPKRLETYNFLNLARLDEIFTPSFLQRIDPDQPIAILQDPYFRTRSGVSLNRMLHLDWKLTLADNDLRKVSQACQLAGVEVRYPMLDERMVDFAARLPPAYKVKGFQLRWFFKKALKDFLPDEIIHKTKHGFGLPFGLWLQTHPPLSALAHQSLNAFRTRQILNDDYLDQLLHLHQRQHASYYGVMIWVIMMLEQWLQRHDISA